MQQILEGNDEASNKVSLKILEPFVWIQTLCISVFSVFNSDTTEARLTLLHMCLSSDVAEGYSRSDSYNQRFVFEVFVK